MSCSNIPARSPRHSTQARPGRMKPLLLIITSLVLLEAKAVRDKKHGNKELGDKKDVKTLFELNEEEKKARIELIDEILKFYQETLEDLKSMRKELTEYLMPRYENDDEAENDEDDVDAFLNDAQEQADFVNNYIESNDVNFMFTQQDNEKWNN